MYQTEMQNAEVCVDAVDRPFSSQRIYEHVGGNIRLFAHTQASPIAHIMFSNFSKLHIAGKWISIVYLSPSTSSRLTTAICPLVKNLTRFCLNIVLLSSVNKL